MSVHAQGHEPAAHQSAPPPPVPSVWPLIALVASLLLGIALVAWRNDWTDATGPFLGGTVAFEVVALGGWAYTDSMTRRRAEHGEADPDVSYPEVVSFRIPIDQLAKAQGEGGILKAFERADDELNVLPGFGDLRITVAPPDNDQVAVQVETTWASRGPAADRESGRRVLSAVAAAHDTEVVKGSLQMVEFDVVHDTRRSGFHLSVGAFAAVLGACLIAGFLGGSVIGYSTADTTSISPSSPTGGNGAAPVDANRVSVTAVDNRFNKTSLTATAGAEFTVEFTNAGKLPHNIRFLDKKGGADLVDGAATEILPGGGSATIRFTVAQPGSYFYQCDVHPAQMTGSLTVK